MLPPNAKKKIAASKKEDPNACVTAGITNDGIQIYRFKKLWINFKKLQVGNQGAKKIIFTACHSGKLKLAFTSPVTSFQLAPKTFSLAELISQFFCSSNSSKNITCLSGKLKTEFTSPIAKSTSPGLSDTTFFAHWQ